MISGLFMLQRSLTANLLSSCRSQTSAPPLLHLTAAHHRSTTVVKWNHTKQKRISVIRMCFVLHGQASAPTIREYQPHTQEHTRRGEHADRKVICLSLWTGDFLAVRQVFNHYYTVLTSNNALQHKWMVSNTIERKRYWKVQSVIYI